MGAAGADMILDNEDYQILIQWTCTWSAWGCPMVQRNLFPQKEPQWCYWHINVHRRNFQTFPRHATGWPCFTQQKFPSVLYIITWNLPIKYDSVIFWMLVKLIIRKKKTLDIQITVEKIGNDIRVNIGFWYSSEWKYYKIVMVSHFNGIVWVKLVSQSNFWPHDGRV